MLKAFAVYSTVGFFYWIIVIVGCWLGSCVVMGEWLTYNVFEWDVVCRSLLVIWTVIVCWITVSLTLDLY
jgi:hypothetical protein